jgi:PAS domain-containing protein
LLLTWHPFYVFLLQKRRMIIVREGIAMQETLTPISKRRITSDEFSNFIDYFPALLWRIDIVENKIEYLNNHHITGLGEKSGLILQNMNFSRNIVLEADFYLLEQFMQAVRDGRTAATIFRIQLDTGNIVWIKVTGTPYRTNPRFYLGYMLDVSDTVGIVQEITERDAEQMAMIETLDYPVILLNAENNAIMAHNAAAREVFGYRPGEFSRLTTYRLFHAGTRYQLNRIFEAVVFEKKWEGQLVFQTQRQATFTGDTTIRCLVVHGNRICRLSIHGIAKDAALEGSGTDRAGTHAAELPTAGTDADYRRRLTAQVENETDMPRILSILLHHPPDGVHFDAIIYSDVYTKRNRVVVYTAGKALEAMQQGEVFPYAGTIAENIDRYGLDHLIMEDTFSSIKAIDWALFIPHGIRSYFAKPFYERKTMRSVLIICSTERNRFSEAAIHRYALLNAPFLKGLKNWRRATKGR